MRVAALPGDAHTSVQRSSGFHRLPLRLVRLADGFYVVAAEAALTEALGARLVAVGDVEAMALEAGAAPLVSHENEFRTCWRSRMCFTRSARRLQSRARACGCSGRTVHSSPSISKPARRSPR